MNAGQETQQVSRDTRRSRTSLPFTSSIGGAACDGRTATSTDAAGRVAAPTRRRAPTASRCPGAGLQSGGSGWRRKPVEASRDLGPRLAFPGKLLAQCVRFQSSMPRCAPGDPCPRRAFSSNSATRCISACVAWLICFSATSICSLSSRAVSAASLLDRLPVPLVDAGG